MMTKKNILFTLIISLNSFFVFSQKEEIVIGHFDNDNLIDTLYFKDVRFIDEFREKDITYECKVVRGNGKKNSFNLPLGYDSVQISQGKNKGNLEVYQWKTGSQGFEITEYYIYKEEYNNWILEKSETIYENGKKEVYKSKVPTGINGIDYIKTKYSIEGEYTLNSCQKSRFKIQIQKKGVNYFYSILDNKKIISKGKTIINDNKKTISIKMGNIEGKFFGGNIQIQNYSNSTNKLIHFTQCNEKFLMFNKKE